MLLRLKIVLGHKSKVGIAKVISIISDCIPYLASVGLDIEPV
jgi:hypothetical protein